MSPTQTLDAPRTTTRERSVSRNHRQHWSARSLDARHKWKLAKHTPSSNWRSLGHSWPRRVQDCHASPGQQKCGDGETVCENSFRLVRLNVAPPEAGECLGRARTTLRIVLLFQTESARWLGTFIREGASASSRRTTGVLARLSLSLYEICVVRVRLQHSLVQYALIGAFAQRMVEG